MGMRIRVVLDHGSIGAMLKGGLGAGEVNGAAARVAAGVRGSGIMVDGDPGKVPLPVQVSVIVTDRVHARVTITHPSGMAVQAKHGVLTSGLG